MEELIEDKNQEYLMDVTDSDGESPCCGAATVNGILCLECKEYF